MHDYQWLKTVDDAHRERLRADLSAARDRHGRPRVVRRRVGVALVRLGYRLALGET